MTKIEIAKKKLEYKKVACAKDEMELKILEREDEIQRLKDNIKIQNERLLQLDEELEEFK